MTWVQMTSKCARLSKAAGGGELGVPAAGVLDGALLRAEVYIGEAKALGIAFGPFKIVHQAPVMVGPHVDAIEHGAAKRVQVAAHEFDAAVVADGAVFVGNVEIGTAVLGDLDGSAFVFVGNAHEELVEAVGPDFPSEIGERALVGIGIVKPSGVFA